MTEIAAARRNPTAIAIARSLSISALLPGDAEAHAAGYTTKRKSRSRRGFAIVKTRILRLTTRYFVYSRSIREADAAPSGAQGVVQFSYQTLRPRNRVGRIVPSLSLLLMQVIRYVQRREDGNFCRVDGRRSPGHFF